ncbi:TetR family transcriptional regulator [Acidimicrobiaceae bacterium USS-CC1]|uniref:TetR family transcriptional regulator n=1 Tax=Acidiferrimicrobium australe TaxID=2664430 RepID=A0ABW9QRJ9_9ACTN|nr:TetR family transcriptional regulator [Acidiferrimicrobium australe]
MGSPAAEGSRRLTLSELVACTSVPASTIHHYLRAGLMPPPLREAPNRFSYDERHVTALRYIRALRGRRGMRLEEIAEELPQLLAHQDGDALGGEDSDEGDATCRLLEAAAEAFRTRSFAEVTVGEIAEAAHVGKGSVYRHFSSKEELFTATVERLLARTEVDFAETIERLGGPDGVATAPEKTAGEFARLVAVTMPVLLELGARAAKGHEPSRELARRVLSTMAEAAGRPLTPGSEDPEEPADPIPAGITVIKDAFSTVLSWAVGPDWPAGVWPDDDLAEDDDDLGDLAPGR